MMYTIPAHLPSVAMDRLEYAIRSVTDQQLHCVLRLAGRVDAARLARAVRLSLDAEPVLGCRFVERAWRPAWERRADLDDLDHCPLEEPTGREEALARHIVAPLDLAEGPQARARLFRGADDVLCLTLSHAVADGGAVIEYAGLLGSIYRALAADPAYTPGPNLRGDRSQWQVFRRLPAAALPWSLARQGAIPAPAWGFPSHGRDLSGRTVLVRRLAPERVEALRRCGRAAGGSVNDVLLAAFFRALCAVIDPPLATALHVQVPVNLRRYLPGGRAGAICNLAGAVYPALRREPGASFAATFQRVRAALAAAHTGLPGLGQALTLELAMALPYTFVKRITARALRGAQTGKTHPFLTNMGVIDPAWVDFGDSPVVEAYGIGPVLYPPGFMLAASTYRGVLTLATSFCHTAVDAALVGRCLDLVEAEISTWTGQ